MLCKYCSWYITYANSTDLFIFCFTEVGKGYITPWDLERMATMILSGQILRYLRWSVALIVMVMERFVFDFHSNLSINVFIWNPIEKIEPVWFMRFAKHSLAPENELELTVLFPLYLPPPKQVDLYVWKHPGSPWTCWMCNSMDMNLFNLPMLNEH